MKNGTLRVSRSVLLLEVLCCFTPVSLVFIHLIIVLSNIPISNFSATLMIYTVCSLIGPIGIILGTRLLLRGPFVMGKMLKVLLNIPAVGIVTIGIVGIITANIKLDNSLLIRFDNSWLFFILITVMPAVAAFHINYLSQERTKKVLQ